MRNVKDKWKMIGASQWHSSLNNLHPARARPTGKRLGAAGTGLGKTSGRGEKGQKSRSGYSMKVGLKAARCPCIAGCPNAALRIFQKEVDRSQPGRSGEQFAANDEVTPELMHHRGIIKKAKHDIVVLAMARLPSR